MQASRDEIIAVLRSSRKLGGARRRLVTAARETLRESHSPPWEDPRLIARDLGKGVRSSVSMIEQSCVDGRDLVYRFDNRDPRDWGLNMFLALSQARLEDLGIAPTRANVIMFAGYLAIPDIVGTAEAFEKQTHLPFWYIAAYCHARASGTESGVMRLVVS